MTFEHLTDDYIHQKEAHQFDLIKDKMDEVKLHMYPFVVNQNKKKMKYEYAFLDDQDPGFVHSFLRLNDPYEATKDERLRSKWIEEAKLLYGEFKPTGP